MGGMGISLFGLLLLVGGGILVLGALVLILLAAFGRDDSRPKK